MPLINFAGLASGIDSEALIDAIRESRRAVRVVPKEEEIAEIEAENTALGELDTLLTEFQTLLADFREINGGGIEKTVTSSDETSVSAIANTNANNGVYTIDSVTQLASNHTIALNPVATVSSTDADITTVAGEEGAISFEIGTGPEETINIDVGEDMTWFQLVSEINATTDLVTAQMVNVAAPGGTADYKLVLTSNNVGTEKGLISSIDLTVAHSESGDQDLSTYLVADTANQEAAVDAQFTLAGIAGTIERSSNTINDIIPGVTISLEDTFNTAVTLQVQTDVSTTESKVTTFIEKYNEIVTFINENDQVVAEQDGNDIQNIFGALANTRVDDGVLSSIRSEISGTKYEVGPIDDPTNAVRLFADLGIATERDGTLKFETTGDAAAGKFNFQDAINDEPESVGALLASFAETVAHPTTGIIQQYIGFELLIDDTEKLNNERIETLNDEIARAEDSIQKEEDTIRARFARLESLISGLQSQQAALTSALAGLGGG